MTYDIAALLDRGRASVSNTQTYVAACRTLGYRQPDLTAHGAQVVQWYGAEDGMDLAVLDADCGRLRAAVGAAEEALEAQRTAAGMLEAGWTGGSGSAATNFVDRHCGSGAAVVTLLRTAADVCAALRDALWPLMGDKVHAAVAIDDRRAEVRPAWLAAAQTVMSGAADRAEAADVVAHQITPYVDADIRTDWLGAMRTATNSVAAVYENAVHRLNAVTTVHFEMPAQLVPPPPDAPRTGRPVYSAPEAAPVVTAPAPAPVLPASAPVAPPAPPPVTLPPQPALAAEVPMAQPLPQTPPTGIGGAAPPGVPAMPDIGGGLSGLAGQLADAVGALLTGQPGLPTDPSTPGPDPSVTPPEDTAPPDEDTKAPEPESDSVMDGGAGPEETDPVPPPPEEPAGDNPPPEPMPAEVAPPEPPPSDPPADPADERTPCEIAADELPQVGQ
ncbi:MAG: hypothetical protein U0Q47_03050 [Mycobacterium sp.]